MAVVLPRLAPPTLPLGWLVRGGTGIKAKLVTAVIYLQDFGIVLKIVF